MNDTNNYGGVHSPYEDVHDTPDNEDKGVLSGKDMTLDDYKTVVNPIDNYSPDRDDHPKDGLADDHDMMKEKYNTSGSMDHFGIDSIKAAMGETVDTDISGVTDIDSRKPVMNPAQMILDQKLNLIINSHRIIIERLDTTDTKIDDLTGFVHKMQKGLYFLSDLSKK